MTLKELLSSNPSGELLPELRGCETCRHRVRFWRCGHFGGMDTESAIRECGSDLKYWAPRPRRWWQLR